MDEFDKIINTLGTSFVIFIENDFRTTDSGDIAISKFAVLSPNNKILLLKLLGYKNKNEALSLLKGFQSEFDQLNHNNEELNSLLPFGEVRTYLANVTAQNSLFNILDSFQEVFNADSDLKSIFMLCGIFEINSRIYDGVIDRIYTNEIEATFLFYDNFVPANIDELENIFLLVGMPSNYNIIAIIDNKLGNGDDHGIKIAQDILPRLSNHNLNSYYNIIFTSTSTNDPNIFEDKNYLVVSKSGGDIIGDICNNIAFLAYSRILQYFHKQMSESLNRAKTLVGSNKKNLFYFLDKSCSEGIPPFEAIKIWYDNIINSNIDDAILNSAQTDNIFTSVFSLTKILSKNFAEDSSVADAEFQKNAVHINTSEMFDYSINAKLSPIAPGDIFLINNKLFMLIGQNCDIILRPKNALRNSKIAEVVGASFLKKDAILQCLKKQGYNKKEISKQAKMKVLPLPNDVIALNNFKYPHDEIGYLELSFRTKNTWHYDYTLFDLSMYNLEGKCEILKGGLPNDLKRYFGTTLTSHYEKISAYLYSVLDDSVNLKNFNIFSDFPLNTTDIGDKITFPAQRICRLRKNYTHYVHQKYWGYRGRIDLNTHNLLYSDE